MRPPTLSEHALILQIKQPAHYWIANWAGRNFAGRCKQGRRLLEPFTRPLNEAKKERIKEYVVAEAPQYRPLLKHKSERLDALRSNLTKEQLGR